MESKIEYLKADNKQLREDRDILLERERRIRKDIVFSLILGLIGIVALIIALFEWYT